MAQIDSASALAGARDERDEALPVAGLLALASTGFVAIMTETLPAGLLPQIAEGLDISTGMAGQLVSVYALGSVVASIPLVAATSGWRRRSVLLATVGGFLVFNTVTVFSPVYAVTVIARFFAGVAAGLGWGIISGYARRMSPTRLQGRGMALAMLGVPIALSIGTPAGTWLGTWVGWRAAFGVMSILSLVLVGWILLFVPDYPGQRQHERMRVAQVFMLPGVRPIMATVLGWMLAHNILYTYIAPFLAPIGLADHVDAVLLLFGISALGGIGLAAIFVDRALRTMVLTSLLAFAIASIALGVAGGSLVLVLAAVVVWGVTFGGAATLLQTALADAAGDGVDLAQSIMATAWNAAIAGGGLLGGVLLSVTNISSFPWALLVLVLAALAMAWHATSSFPPGPRT